VRRVFLFLKNTSDSFLHTTTTNNNGGFIVDDGSGDRHTGRGEVVSTFRCERNRSREERVKSGFGGEIERRDDERRGRKRRRREEEDDEEKESVLGLGRRRAFRRGERRRIRRRGGFRRRRVGRVRGRRIHGMGAENGAKDRATKNKKRLENPRKRPDRWRHA
jgi:hypothetical protein